MAISTAKRIMYGAVCASVALTAGLAWAQGHEDPPGAWLAGLTATQLLGMALMGSLGVLGFVVRFMAGKWMAVLEENTQALTGVRDVIAKCPGAKKD